MTRTLLFLYFPYPIIGTGDTRALKAVLFDLFGTLITAESDDNAHRALSEKLAHIHDYAFTGEEHFKLYYELVHGKRSKEKLTSSKAVWEALRELSVKYGFKLKIDYPGVRKLHLMFHIAYAEPYPDAIQALEKARRLCGRVGLVSDADNDMAYGILYKLKFLQYLDTVVTSEEVGVNKPNPKIFLIAAERLGVRPENTAMIGDSWKDIEGSKKAGMKAVLVLRRREVLNNLTVEPDAIVENLLQAVNKVVELLDCRG